MNIWMTRTLKGLEPHDDAAAASLRRLKLKDVFKVEITKPRNIAFHRKFFALLNLVWSATGDWANVTELLDDLKFNLGHYERRRIVDRKTGEVFEYIKLKSISFAAMDELEFDAFYESALLELCAMAGGIEFEALRSEVLNQLAAA